jgi:hypothetical protein
VSLGIVIPTIFTINSVSSSLNRKDGETTNSAQWTIAIDDKIVLKPDGIGHSLTLALFDTSEQNQRRLLRHEMNDDVDIAQVINAILLSHALVSPTNQEDATNSIRRSAGIRIIISQHTNNRGVNLSFRAEDAIALSLSDEIEKVIELCNNLLKKQGQSERIRLSP